MFISYKTKIREMTNSNNWEGLLNETIKDYYSTKVNLPQALDKINLSDFKKPVVDTQEKYKDKIEERVEEEILNYEKTIKKYAGVPLVYAGLVGFGLFTYDMINNFSLENPDLKYNDIILPTLGIPSLTVSLGDHILKYLLKENNYLKYQIGKRRVRNSEVEDLFYKGLWETLEIEEDILRS